MTGFYVQSMLASKVIQAPGALPVVGASLDASVIANSYFSVPTSAETQAAGYQLWNLSPGGLKNRAFSRAQWTVTSLSAWQTLSIPSRSVARRFS
jgi:hypothetical protein